MRVIVTGMIATYPVGGVAWDYGQYALGLERLGCEVYYLEHTAIAAYAQDPATGGYVEDYARSIEFLAGALAQLSPTLGARWHVRAANGQTFGMEAAAFHEIIASADLLVNVSGGCLLLDEYRTCPRRLLIDTDPGWNHLVIFPRWSGAPEAVNAWGDRNVLGLRGHTHFATYARGVGSSGSLLSDFGVRWHRTLPPVVTDCWKPEPPGERWTTVMNWKSFNHGIQHGGRIYGSKEMEFPAVESLPSLSRACFEVAVNGRAPTDRWRELGWSVEDSLRVSETVDTYRSYIQGSRGEFSVAKNVYVAAHTGWFSCRTVCYLAAGRPAVVQDTGWSDYLPTGEGLFAFRDAAGAVAAIDAIERDYPRHQQAARFLAETRFDSSVVLTDLLDQVAVG